MTKNTLLLFMKRILECGSKEKSAAALNQLREILEQQNADPEMIRLVQQALGSLPEAKYAAQCTCFSEESLRTAARRADDRKRREAEMADRGRC